MQNNDTKIVHNVIVSSYKLEADLVIPSGANSIILFAHGSGSSRHSTRNQFVASVLNGAGFATLLVDLLTPQEKEIDEKSRHLRFDIDLLAERVLTATRWLFQQPETSGLKIGYFGSSTGAAAALISSSKLGNAIKTVVSRGGRPDLAISRGVLSDIRAPVLFIVGGNDSSVIALNKSALKQLSGARARDLAIIPGAGHLFEELGKIEEVANIAVDWFECYLLDNGRKFENKYRQKNSGFISFFKEKPHLQVRFKDRSAAGELLGSLLSQYKNDKDVVAVGIPCGGAIVADRVARKLNVGFGILVSRRLRTPEHSEQAMGAIMQDGYAYLDQRLIESMKISSEYVELEKSEQMAEISRRADIYRSTLKGDDIKGKKVILVDDGAATGATIIAAATWLKRQEPRLLVIGLPVAPKEVVGLLTPEADDVKVISIPSNSKFGAVEQFYDDFSPVSDSEVLKIVQENLKIRR